MSASIPWDELFAAAATHRARAHAPYSRFHVGAAVLFEEGALVPGCNVENSSYGLSLCAERNAIARGVADGRRVLKAVAIVVDARAPVPPCGMCRQVMAEFAGPDLQVRTRTLHGQEQAYTLGELLPHAFTREFL